jgi:methionine sulfoxide reductase heme-binding subunit
LSTASSAPRPPKPLFHGPLPWIKPGLILGGISPLLVLLFRGLRGTLDANPIEEILNQLGLLALVFLVASLACTPAKKLLGWTWPMRIRRALGLLAFFYAALHVLTYLVPDKGLKLGEILEDIVERKFIAAGFFAFLALVPLAVTSTDAWVKTLGYARWQKLHRLAYVAGGLAALHFVWRVKADYTRPFVVVGMLLVLFGVRVVLAVRKGAPKRT